MPWWLEKPMRLIQTNLREIDADLDPDEFMRQLREFSANVLLFNVGGIIANYPTELEFHWRNPFLRGDLVGEVLERARQNGIRFLARFDFSKINETLAARRPEWLYVGAKGERVNYNGQVHTCLNGGYQQEYAHEILAEAIRCYPVDGVFFNMFGYQTRDYGGVRHGICQCENCRSRYRAFCGEELPSPRVSDDASSAAYRRFQAHTVREKIEAIVRQIKQHNPEIAVCTYVTEAVDIVRRESNSAADRPKPEWGYSATEHTASVLSGWRDKTVSNSAVHFLDIPYRHVGVSPHLTSLRLAENIANAAWLDYYVIGPLERQDNRACFEMVKDLYRFHAENERWYSGVRPVGDVCLIRPGGKASTEFRGLLRLLAEHHVLFHILDEAQVAKSGVLSSCQAAILPDASNPADDLKRSIDDYVAGGGRLLATGLTGARDDEGLPAGVAFDFECLGRPPILDVLPARRGSYWRVAPRDREALRGFQEIDLLYIDDEACHCALPAGARGFLGYVPGDMYGPPEKCYYREETSVPGLICRAHGKGIAALIPWRLGRHYASQGSHGHAALFRAILFDLLGLQPSIQLDASPLIEMRSQIRSDGAWQLVSLVNHSGQNGVSFLPPLPTQNIEISMRAPSLPAEARALRLGRALPVKAAGEGRCRFTLPRLDLLETIVARYT